MNATLLAALLLLAPPGMGGAADDAPAPATAAEEVPADTGPSADDVIYHPVEVEVIGMVWFGPGQRGLIEAHPLVMGLGVMALATVTLLFFFLRGVKRPRDNDK